MVVFVVCGTHLAVFLFFFFLFVQYEIGFCVDRRVFLPLQGMPRSKRILEDGVSYSARKFVSSFLL